MITNYNSGAYMCTTSCTFAEDHQVLVGFWTRFRPDTNIASNVGPQFDPKDID